MFSIVVEVRVRPRFFDQVGHEISIFSQNHVNLPKLWTTSSNISKSVLSKSFFCFKNWLNLFKKNNLYEEYWTKRPNDLEILIFKILYFSKIVPNFCWLCSWFWTMTRFIEKMFISSSCIHGFMSNLIKKSWTDSSGGRYLGSAFEMNLLPTSAAEPLHTYIHKD